MIIASWQRVASHMLAAIGLLTAFAGPVHSNPTEQKSPPLELVVLGSGGPGAVGRAASCHLVIVDGTPRLMVDAGHGCFVRLGETGLPLPPMGIQLLTHPHADHAGDLPGLVKARAVATRAPITFEIFGPDGHGRQGEIAYFPSTSQFVNPLFGTKGAFAYLPDFAGRLTFEVLGPPKAPPILYTLRSPPGAIGRTAGDSAAGALVLAKRISTVVRRIVRNFSVRKTARALATAWPMRREGRIPARRNRAKPAAARPIAASDAANGGGGGIARR